MTIEIACPSCDFRRTILKSKIPPGARWATCPRCNRRFEISHQASGPGSTLSIKENHKEIVRRQGIYHTFKSVLFSPEKYFESIVSTKGIKDSLAFGLLFGTLGMMFGLFWQFLIISGSGFSLGRNMLSHLNISIFYFMLIVISPVIVIIGIFFMSAILHLCLMIVGAGKNGFEGTFRVVSYSHAPLIWGFIPFVGGIIGWFWQMVILFIGVRVIHETTYLRVIFSFFIPIIVIVILFVMVLFLIIA